ncbi:hypothetical protein [Streptomyces sp. MMBL 11-3]|uniref:hypothetical protein n=1 Tax=Streptomyces sp. MMBL 11-3 TaxID=3382639 RepID=UPI0039B4D63E
MPPAPADGTDRSPSRRAGRVRRASVLCTAAPAVLLTAFNSTAVATAAEKKPSPSVVKLLIALDLLWNRTPRRPHGGGQSQDGGHAAQQRRRGGQSWANYGIGPPE